MTSRLLAQRSTVAAVALVAMLFAAPAAAPGSTTRGPLAGPSNLRVAATTPHSVTLAWNAATNAESFTYVIDASYGYRVGVQPPATSYTWTRDLVPGRTYSFVMWAADAKGRESTKSNTVTVTLPVDTRAPARPVVFVTGTTSSTVDLAWEPVADDDSSCCTYRVSADGAPVSVDSLHWTGARSLTVLRQAASSTHTYSIVAVDPSRNESAPSEPVSATTPASADVTAPSRPGGLYAFDFGCETWLFWTQSTDDVDPQYAIRYEVFVNGAADGGQNGVDRWIAYGTQSANTYSVDAVDSAGNRSTSSVTLTNQSC
jgi:hypothetical protein